MSFGSFTNCYLQTICLQIIYLICMYKQDFALNDKDYVIKYNQAISFFLSVNSHTYILYMMWIWVSPRAYPYYVAYAPFKKKFRSIV